MNTKDNMSELDKILQQTGMSDNLPGTTSTDISNELPEPEPLFDVDYDHQEKKLRRRSEEHTSELQSH